MEYWYEQLESCGKSAIVEELRALLPSAFWTRVSELHDKAMESRHAIQARHNYENPMTSTQASAFNRHARYIEILSGILSERSVCKTLGYLRAR